MQHKIIVDLVSAFFLAVSQMVGEVSSYQNEKQLETQRVRDKQLGEFLI